MEGTGEFCECGCKCVIRVQVLGAYSARSSQSNGSNFRVCFFYFFFLWNQGFWFLFPFVYHPTLLSYRACGK